MRSGWVPWDVIVAIQDGRCSSGVADRGVERHQDPMAFPASVFLCKLRDLVIPTLENTLISEFRIFRDF